MKDFPLLNIHEEQLVAKRKEAIVSLIGNSFATTTPFAGVPKIVDKTNDALIFHSVGVLPEPWFGITGKLEMEDEGVKTRVKLSMNLLGLLLWSYAFHWLPAVFLWAIHGLWATLINPSVVSLVQDWVLFTLLIWPGLLFLVLRRRIRVRMRTYLHNLIYCS